MKLLILSDIHANWPALEAVLAAESGVDHIICAGDLVNYGPHPVQCVEWMRSHSSQVWIAQGNHDLALATAGNPQCSKPFREMAAEGGRFTALQLDAEEKQYLSGLPLLITQQVENRTITVCHAVPSTTPYAYVSEHDVARWQSEVAYAQRPDYLVVGHTHMPFVMQIDKTTVINPGSVGQPKDGDSRASYAVWEDGEVALRRASYDVQAVVRDLFNSGITEGIARQLAHVLLTGGMTLA